MSFGANSLLDMGRWALFASQVQLQVTGENIANVNTDGYSRRSVILEEGPSINYSPGQLGTGVVAKEVVRHFDDMVEAMYLGQSSLTNMWGNLWEQLKGVENLLNESSNSGVSDALSSYFNSWNEVAQRPDNYGARQTVVNDAATLISTLKQVDTDLSLMQERINKEVAAQVSEANTLMQEIADLNREIQVNNVEGQNNTNALFDERARKTRALALLVDIKTIDNGGGNFTILTESGQNLVDGESFFSLEFNSARNTVDLRPSSTFEGNVYFDGNDDYEYTIEFVASNAGDPSGQVGSGAGAAQFKVSLDGGVSWLTNEDGSEKHFSAREYDSRVNVEGLQIWFGSTTDSQGTPSGTFVDGDRFIISPHQGLYWVQNTSHAEEITPQQHFNGEVNTQRLTGGSIAALLTFRDTYVGKYRSKLDELAESVVWETNRRHSQGAGLQAFTSVEGTYKVDYVNKALGSDSTGLAFGDRIQSGSSFVYVYNKSTGLLTSSAALDFDGTGGTFNPAIHTLEDVRDAFNSTYAGTINASIVNNQLRLEAEPGYTFAFGTDSAGLYAALGINTFLKGDSAGTMAVNEKITSDLDYLATGHVNGAGEMNTGDNTTALSMYELREVNVTTRTAAEGTTSQTILDYYNGIVGNVGTDTNRANFNKNFFGTLSKDLNERQQQVSGVNLDEEMSDLIKYQASYTAAAKLITTADQMLQTILSLKP
ncbi:MULTISPECIES: flagellar hook-associated protein FlgK [unclassified Pseudodesulfovibrio]|uniref:flagellar hook-associated protein FlgK n=1 Tax=unclassified Pseudodesulfovibrio TaxID=2661612 RepID=UPI000FEC1D53|nr:MULTISPECIES: flagellar hook-associated protein FlgK [unclassified Pseudodesulfovibrio]MCJ2163185.1 flagellar hook-associated protein FlgK [Pseudodesulfovibrio sp. S3-i]RWU07173.1 flagellar hook-associated protein FlgK [Pseudodesulfovibrio sp. S3]